MILLNEKQIERFAEYFPEIQYYRLTKEENQRIKEQFDLAKMLTPSKNSNKTGATKFGSGFLSGTIMTLIMITILSILAPNSGSINRTSNFYEIKESLAKYWYPVTEQTDDKVRAKNLLRFSEIRHAEAKSLMASGSNRKNEFLKSTLLKAGDNFRAALELDPTLRSEKITETLTVIKSWAKENNNDEITEIVNGLEEMYRTATLNN